MPDLRPALHELFGFPAFRRGQEEACTAALEGRDVLLVMPTGSGKTYTAAHWLTRRVVDQGVRVFRLSHRPELLDLPAGAVSDLTFLALGRTAVIRP